MKRFIGISLTLLLAAIGLHGEQFRAVTRAAVAAAWLPSPKMDAAGRIEPRFDERHRENLARAAKGDIGLLFLGDSITEGWFWGDNRKLWDERFAKRSPANFGIGGDRTEHLLWRIENGELDGINPRTVVLLIGTNNIGSPAEEIGRGVLAVVGRIRDKLPQSRLVIMAILPRRDNPSDSVVAEMRARIESVNRALAVLDDGTRTRYLDLGPRLTSPGGALPKAIFPDGLHLSLKGYRIWADALEPLLQ